MTFANNLQLDKWQLQDFQTIKEYYLECGIRQQYARLCVNGLHDQRDLVELFNKTFLLLTWYII